MAEREEIELLSGSIPTVRSTVEGTMLPVNHVVMGCRSRSTDTQM